MGWRVAGRSTKALSPRLRATREASGEKVSIIGWSLGAIMARQQARRHPDHVRQAVSIGVPFTRKVPFTRNPHASSISGLYERLSGETVNGAFIRSVMLESRDCPLPVRPQFIAAGTGSSHGRTALSRRTASPRTSRLSPATTE